MDIDIKELEAFSCVVEKGSFSRAAEMLYLTQPTVSAHVASLERKLGTKLLVRTTKEIYPSDAGNLLYDYAREILRLRSAAVQAVQAFSMEMKGTVTVAAAAIPGQYHLPGLMGAFRTRYPDISFHLRLLSSPEVAEQILSRKAEVGFTDALVNHPKCICRELTEDALVIVTPNTPRYQAWLSAGLPVPAIAKEPFVSREEGSASRAEAEAFLKELGVNPKELSIAVEVHSNESLIQMVSEGLGIAVLPRSACEDYCRFKKLLAFPVSGSALRRKLYLVRHKNAILAPIAQTFCDYVTGAYPSSPEN